MTLVAEAAPVIDQVVVPEGVQTLPVLPGCNTYKPALIDEYTAQTAQELCAARRTVLEQAIGYCGGCACAQLTEIATKFPGVRNDLGHQIKEAMHQGGAH